MNKSCSKLNDVPDTPPPAMGSRAAQARLRTLFDTHYSAQALRQQLGTEIADGGGTNIHELVARTDDRSPCSLLVRLFLAGFEVASGDLVAALGAQDTALLTDLGLIVARGAGFGPCARIDPHETCWIASDVRARHGMRAADFVLGPSPVSQLLAKLTIRRPVASTLDLGCGAGQLAMLAAEHSGTVVATDVNPRAVSFAQFNLALNECASVEVRTGSLFEPVGDARFDLIVCNPPFVISPDTTYIYRDGMSDICRRIVTEAPAHLTADGCLQMLCNWPQWVGEPWSAAVADWVRDIGCDVWLLRIHNLSAAMYSAVWLTQEFGSEGAIPSEAYQRWAGHLKNQNIDSVGSGLLIVRPVTGRLPWCEYRDAPPLLGAAGECIDHTLRCRDYLARLENKDRLLDEVLVPASALELRTRAGLGSGQWNTLGRQLSQTCGLGFTLNLDPVAASIVAMLDGKRTLRELVQAFAAEHGVAPEYFLPQLPAAITELIHRGMLEPALSA